MDRTSGIGLIAIVSMDKIFLSLNGRESMAEVSEKIKKVILLNTKKEENELPASRFSIISLGFFLSTQCLTCNFKNLYNLLTGR